MFFQPFCRSSLQRVVKLLLLPSLLNVLSLANHMQVEPLHKVHGELPYEVDSAATRAKSL